MQVLKICALSLCVLAGALTSAVAQEAAAPQVIAPESVAQEAPAAQEPVANQAIAKEVPAALEAVAKDAVAIEAVAKEVPATHEAVTKEAVAGEAPAAQEAVAKEAPAAQEAVAKEPGAEQATAAAEQICKPGPNALGVSRVVEVDTSAGPRFGFQYNEQSILADGEVVLTFDDGPLRAYTRPVLDALAAHCTLATFFLVGRQALADPELVQEYARRGHTIGTHTWSHANLRALSPQRARAEIEMGFSAVQQALGKPLAPFFRFPFLSDPKTMIAHVQGRQIGIFSIDVDSKDFQTRDPGTVHRRVMSHLAHAKKGIILFHDIQPSTARALPGLLAELKAKGYRVVHLRPKATATTVAEFDALAKQELDRKRAKAVAQPLAKRALTWPVAAGAGTEPAAAKAPADTGSAKRIRRATRPVTRVRAKSNDWVSNAWTW